jgi:predicted permease
MTPGLARRILELLRWRRLDDESREELEHHLELAVAARRRAGFDAGEAARQARLELGNVHAARQALADARAGHRLEQMGRDVVDAVRSLRAAPAVAVASVAITGAGIAATATLFALVNAVVLAPLPLPDPDRLVRIYDTNAALGLERTGAASGNIVDWRQRATLFEGIAGYYVTGRTIGGPGGAEVVAIAQVSQDFFPVLGVPAARGRTFTTQDTLSGRFDNVAAPVGADEVAVVSHGLWQRHFGGDPEIVGRTVLLERRPFRIVGVMPAGFTMPDASVQAWIPWHLSSDRPRDQHYLGAIGRLRPSVTLRSAEDQLAGVARALADEYPATNRGWSVRLVPLKAALVGDLAGTLWLLLGAVALLLLVACANVALLSLLRGLDRQDAAAIRLALGASPARLCRQSLFESAILAAAGGLLGSLAAAAGVRVLTPFVNVVGAAEIAIDSRVLGFIVGATSLAALASGLPPAWRLHREVAAAPAAGAFGRSTAAPSRHRVRDMLVVGQVSLAVLLLAGAGLLVQSSRRLAAVDVGFDPEGVLVAPVFLDAQAYGTGDRVRGYYARLFERLAVLPGVEAVGGATTVPTGTFGPDFDRPVWPEDSSDDESARTPAAVRIVTTGYLSALRIGLAEGRGFDARDRARAAHVVMVNESLARRFWPGQPAVGRRLVVDYSTAGTQGYEVVGVVRDVRFGGPRGVPEPEVYFPHEQRPYLILNVVIRSRADSQRLIPLVRGVLHELDPHKPAHGMYSLESLVAATVASDRRVMQVMLLFAVGATLLAVLSIYGVLAQRVRERAREIAIRSAMGAGRRHLVAWAGGLGFRLVAAGLAAGLVSAWVASGVMSGVLFGVSRTDPITALAVIALVSAIASPAVLVPSWQAIRIDPLAILRRG